MSNANGVSGVGGIRSRITGPIGPVRRSGGANLERSSQLTVVRSIEDCVGPAENKNNHHKHLGSSTRLVGDASSSSKIHSAGFMHVVSPAGKPTVASSPVVATTAGVAIRDEVLRVHVDQSPEMELLPRGAPGRRPTGSRIPTPISMPKPIPTPTPTLTPTPTPATAPKNRAIGSLVKFRRAIRVASHDQGNNGSPGSKDLSLRPPTPAIQSAKASRLPKSRTFNVLHNLKLTLSRQSLSSIAGNRRHASGSSANKSSVPRQEEGEKKINRSKARQVGSSLKSRTPQETLLKSPEIQSDTPGKSLNSCNRRSGSVSCGSSGGGNSNNSNSNDKINRNSSYNINSHSESNINSNINSNNNCNNNGKSPATESHPLYIHTSQPSAYWTGRFVALHDRFQSEQLRPVTLEMLISSHTTKSSLLPRPTSGRPRVHQRPNHLSSSSTTSALHKLSSYAIYDDIPTLDLVHPVTAAAMREAHLVADEDTRCRRIFLHLANLCTTAEAKQSLHEWQQSYARRVGKSSLLPRGGTMVGEGSGRGFGLSKWFSGGANESY